MTVEWSGMTEVQERQGRRVPSAEASTIGGASQQRVESIRVVYLIHSALDHRDYDRFGIDYLVGRGDHITVFDVADLAMPLADKDRSKYGEFKGIEICRIRSLQELKEVHPVLAGADLIMNVVSFLEQTTPIFEVLATVRTPYLILHTCVLPRETLVSSATSGVRALARYSMWRLRQKKVLFALASRFQSILPRRAPLRPADYAVFGGRQSSITSFPVGPRTIAIWAHAQDYDLYAKEFLKKHRVSDCAVFLDEYLPYHRDLQALGNCAPIEASKYYALLRRLFDRVESELGLRVIIAACPRADYSDKGDLFGGREIGYMRTPELVASSRLVIAHRSTAINYAILFKKPIIPTTTREIFHSHHQPHLVGLARTLQKRLLFLDDPGRIDFGGALDVDDRIYADFRENYIKMPDSPDLPFWEIVMSKVNAHMTKAGCRS